MLHQFSVLESEWKALVSNRAEGHRAKIKIMKSVREESECAEKKFKFWTFLVDPRRGGHTSLARSVSWLASTLSAALLLSTTSLLAAAAFGEIAQNK
jgi:hypothetical protein